MQRVLVLLIYIAACNFTIQLTLVLVGPSTIRSGEEERSPAGGSGHLKTLLLTLSGGTVTRQQVTRQNISFWGIV